MKRYNQVYITGAGFSVAAGFPLVNQFSEFLLKHKDRILRRFNEEYYQNFKRVLQIDDSVEQAFEKTIEAGNLEDLFLLENAVAYTLIACCENFVSNRQSKEYYHKFLKLIENQNAKIITLNQDTVLESTINDINDIYEENKTNFRHLRLDYKIPAFAAFIAVGRNKNVYQYIDIPFLKLHGGTNFFQCPDHDWVFISDITNSNHPHRCSKKNPFGVKCNKTIQPMVIPPRKVKNIQPVADIWKEAKVALEEANIITLIGLNLNEADEDFNNLIRQALKKKDKELGFIGYNKNPNVDEINKWKNKIKDLLEYDIQNENIYLLGFESWISQMD